MALNNNPTPNEVVKEIKRLDTDKQNIPVHITTPIDFNNMTTEGIYCLEVYGSTHTPVNEKGVLRVYKVDANRILQIFNTVTYDTSDEEGNDIKMYMRNYTLAVDEDYYTWDTWERIVDDILLYTIEGNITDWVNDTFATKSNLANINSQGFLSDFNSTTPVGNKGHIVTYMYNPSTLNRPSDCAEYGVVIYINGDKTSGTTDWTRQIILPNYFDYGNIEFHRQYINGSWQNWNKVTTQSQELLLSTNTNGTYTVQDLRKWKYIIMAHKDSWGGTGEWITSIYPTTRLENDQTFVLEEPNHNTWSTLKINGSSRTSVTLSGDTNNRTWFQLNAVS